jgi:two-component system chemotaxis response regulator CheB
MKVRTLVVDDSAVYASLIRRALADLPDVEIIGRASNGCEALERIAAERPALVTLDIEMPKMNGIEVLRALKRQKIPSTVVVLSASNPRARAWTIEALQQGAIDFLTKPEGGLPDDNLAALRNRLAPLVSAAGYRQEVLSLLRGAPAPPSPRSSTAPAAPDAPPPRLRPHGERAGAAEPVRTASAVRPAMVLIGASTGGTEALARIIPKLPGDLRVPVLVVQHMPPLFTQNLAESLNSRSALQVAEARHNEIAIPGRVYIAPGGSHLRISAGNRQEIRLQITTDPPENNCRPAVDYLFRSAAAAFPGRAVAVILTGMGRDGTAGMRLLKDSGCFSIAQNEATCAVYGMPKEAIQAGAVDLIAPLDSIAAEIGNALR